MTNASKSLFNYYKSFFDIYFKLISGTMPGIQYKYIYQSNLIINKCIHRKHTRLLTCLITVCQSINQSIYISIYLSIYHWSAGQVFFVTTQLWIFAEFRYAHVNYYTDQTVAFEHFFIKASKERFKVLLID